MGSAVSARTNEQCSSRGGSTYPRSNLEQTEESSTSYYDAEKKTTDRKIAEHNDSQFKDDIKAKGFLIFESCPEGVFYLRSVYVRESFFAPERLYLLFLPRILPSAPLPVVLHFHGNEVLCVRDILSHSGGVWWKLASARGFAVVFCLARSVHESSTLPSQWESVDPDDGDDIAYVMTTLVFLFC
jgi:hypothetical protein